MAENDAPPPPAPPVPVPTGKAAPRALYYLLIDGTNAKDAVAYGELLEDAFGLGWRNLAGEFLDPAPDDPTRLVDPAHPFLPVHLIDGTKGRGKTAVVCPGGKHGAGVDRFLESYSGETADEKPFGQVVWNDLIVSRATFGRKTAYEKSALLIRELILDPGVLVIRDDDANTVTRQFADRRIPLLGPRKGLVRGSRANLLFVSSHGWLGGFMKGEALDPMQTARPDAAQPGGSVAHSYFLVGSAAKSGMVFRGPEWIILAQCSTLNNATWPLWVRLLSGSSPGVRGILAYEEVSPGPGGSVRIAKEFFAKLKTETILDAWRQANRRQKWAAVVHKEAVQDRMRDWRQFRPLSGTATTDTTASYLGFLGAGPAAGEEIFDRSPPFGLKLEHLLILPDKTEQVAEVEPSVLDTAIGALRPSSRYRLTLTAPAGRKIVRAKLRWIHIRPSHPKQFRVDQVFTNITMEAGSESLATVSVDSSTRRDLIITPAAPLESVTFVAFAQRIAVIEGAGIEAHHSYFFPDVTLELDAGSQSFAFRTIGLQYVGAF